MSMVTAVKYLAEFAAEALKPWDPSREKAAVMLADLPLMVRLRADDEATADEVTYLVLGRFAAAEVPTIEGADWLADGVAGLKEMADAAAAWLDKPTQADAAVLVAEAVAVLDDCTCDLNLRQVCNTCQAVPAPVKDLPATKPKRYLDSDSGLWEEHPDDPALLLRVSAVTGETTSSTWKRRTIQRDHGPLVEVTP